MRSTWSNPTWYHDLWLLNIFIRSVDVRIGRTDRHAIVSSATGYRTVDRSQHPFRYRLQSALALPGASSLLLSSLFEHVHERRDLVEEGECSLVQVSLHLSVAMALNCLASLDCVLPGRSCRAKAVSSMSEEPRLDVRQDDTRL